ncbi:MAG: hypothetical protein QG632_753 [Candidatus Dependentiae bacterium]|nr:hypothetical protein [Candidatus Dependentiae bacterium]
MKEHKQSQRLLQVGILYHARSATMQVCKDDAYPL